MGLKMLSFKKSPFWGFLDSLNFPIDSGHMKVSFLPLLQRCDDYIEELGIVNRIGQIGYATSLTLRDMKNEIESVAYLFAAKR